ncbi:MAG: hypothetical protein LBN33_09890, partial [Desulfovibrio sp.]|nr:hypothetical protein [Desulfovibrio sp.]
MLGFWLFQRCGADSTAHAHTAPTPCHFPRLLVFLLSLALLLLRQYGLLALLFFLPLKLFLPLTFQGFLLCFFLAGELPAFLKIIDMKLVNFRLIRKVSIGFQFGAGFVILFQNFNTRQTLKRGCEMFGLFKKKMSESGAAIVFCVHMNHWAAEN